MVGVASYAGSGASNKLPLRGRKVVIMAATKKTATAVSKLTWDAKHPIVTDDGNIIGGGRESEEYRKAILAQPLAKVILTKSFKDFEALLLAAARLVAFENYEFSKSKVAEGETESLWESVETWKYTSMVRRLPQFSELNRKEFYSLVRQAETSLCKKGLLRTFPRTATIKNGRNAGKVRNMSYAQIPEFFSKSSSRKNLTADSLGL